MLSMITKKKKHASIPQSLTWLCGIDACFPSASGAGSNPSLRRMAAAQFVYPLTLGLRTDITLQLKIIRSSCAALASLREIKTVCRPKPKLNER